MAKTTPATLHLTRLGVAFTPKLYDYDPHAQEIGLFAARALDLPPPVVLKTLMTRVDGEPVCVVLASDAEVQMKALAAACEGKSAEMMKPADAERLTGFKVGGISPFGQKKQVVAVLDAAALQHDVVYVNGGQRGMLLEIASADLAAALQPIIATISR